MSLFLMGAAPTVAQETRATITGLITDPTGAIIPGTEITVTNQDTQVAIDTTTNEQGSYRVSFLDPGPYVVRCSTAGFKTAEQRLLLRVGTDMQVDITLEVGQVTESIEVTAVAPLLETANADRGLVIDNRRINTIPLAQGNPIFLLALTAGANPGASSTAFKYDEPAYNVASGFSFQGAPTGSNKYTLNGVNNSLSEFGGGVGPALQPPTDAVQEFKINQAYSAEQGHSSGTSIDISLKTGTNDFHGSIYGFFRESKWAANSFFNNRAGTPNSDQTYKRIGASVGGPIVKNRTFFSATLEVTRQKSLELIGTATVPMAEQLTGDFSQLLALGPQFQIYDPLTTTPTGDGLFRRDPFPNNMLPASRLHPISQELSQFWPAPNTAGGPDGSSNFRPNTASPTNWDQYFVRVDHNFSQDSRLFFHYGTLDSDIQWKDTFDNLSTGHRQFIHKQAVGLDFVHVLSPSSLLNLRYGILRVSDPRFEKSNCAKSPECFDITTLGLDPAFVNQLDLSQSALPHIFIEGYRGISDDVRNNIDNSDVHNLMGSVAHSRGNHSFKFGFEMWQLRYNKVDDRWTMPRYFFGSDFTRGPFNTSAPAPTGQGLASYLMGQHSGGFVSRKDNFSAHNAYWGWFVEDKWRATSKLTLNLGLRAEYYGSVTERFNRSTRGFDFNASSPVEDAARAAYAENPIPELPVDQFRVRGGLLFAGLGGVPRELYDAPDVLFGPRFGFAYRAQQNTVFRGGYGIYYVPVGIDGNRGSLPQLNGFNRNTDFVPTLNEGVTFIANIENPTPNGIKAPLQAAGGLATNIGQSVSFGEVDNLKVPNVQRWSLGLQRMLPNEVVLDVAYVGSRGSRLFVSRNLNALPNIYLSTSDSRDQATIDFLSAAVPNPFSGLLPGSGLNTAFTNRNQLLRPFPHFRSVNLSQTNQGYSWYQGLETKLEKRFAQGHSYILSYTWSRDMQATSFLNAGDPAPAEVIAARDRAHRLSVTAIAELPFGQGKKFGSGVSSAADKIIGGWEVSAVWQLHSGFPLGFGDIFTTGSLQNVALSGSARTFERWFNTDAGFVRDPAAQPASHLRTSPFRFGDIRSDKLDFWDISLIKNTYITESQYVQFQAQFLNAFNRTSFARVNTNPASGSFGRVTGDMTWPRRIMFGVKYIF